MSKQNKVLIAALVAFATLVVIAIKTNKPLPSTREESTAGTEIAAAASSRAAPAPASSVPTSGELPAVESAAPPDKPAEQATPQSQPEAVATPAEEEPERSAKPETVEPVAPPEEPQPKRLPRLVEVGAEKCIPCRMMQPILTELRQEYGGKLQIDFVDVGKDPEQADKYGIQTIPTQVIYDSSGKEVFRHIGFYPKEEILAKFKELGIDLE